MTPAAGPVPGATRPDYGLDAPGVVRNLVLASVAGFALWIVVQTGVWSGRFAVGGVVFETAGMWICVALGCGAMAGWMAWSSTVGKVTNRETLLDVIAWTGDERVLDAGCGRGLRLIGAAKRRTTSHRSRAPRRTTPTVAADHRVRTRSIATRQATAPAATTCLSV